MTAPADRPAFGPVRTCQICGSAPLSTVLDLGHQPPVHAHLTEESVRGPETSFPLRLVRCADCGLLQIDYIPDPKVVFPDDYPYHTGMTNMLIRACGDLADRIVAQYSLGSSDLVVDIGSNDGTLLDAFRKHGVKVLGIEPTNVAKVANSRGIETEQAFFDPKLASTLVASHGRAKIITATNVFAHIADPYGTLEGVKTLLADDGAFVSESQYLMDIVEKLEFDTIYHEHLRFYALKPMIRMFERAGMTLTDAERVTSAGGSIRVTARPGSHEPSARVAELIHEEERAGLYDPARLETFAGRSQSAKRHLLALLLEAKEEGARIVGLGAPARSNTLLCYAGIDGDILDYAAERTGSPKIGLFTPGMHLPVVDERRILDEQPEYTLLLSWHIGEELAKKLRSLGYRGKFIMPLPEPRILDI